MRRPSLLRSKPFSAQLAVRILAVVGAGSLSASASCSSKSMDYPPVTMGSGGSRTGTTMGAGAGGSTGALVGFDAGIPEGGLGPPPPATECFPWPVDAGDCPSDPTVILFELDKNGCTDAAAGPTMEASDVVSGPDAGPDPDGGDASMQCCYVVNFQWCIAGGRPYLVEGRARTASPRLVGEPGRGSPNPSGRDGGPCVDGLTPADRAALADAWTADALLEHASVASFSRFSLALLAAGAPAHLVERAHRAALDELRHASLCFALASAYAGEGVGPGPFPTGDRIEVSASLAALAASTVREGCVGETVSAIVAAEQAARASDPAVRAALAEIAADEARHAELAWSTVAWAIEAGGSDVREAVERAFEAELGRSRAIGEGTASATMEAHGRLDPATLARVAASAMEQVVGPSARALMGLHAS